MLKCCALAGLLGLAGNSVYGQVLIGNKANLTPGTPHYLTMTLTETDANNNTTSRQVVGCRVCHAPHNGAQASGGAWKNGAFFGWAQPMPDLNKVANYNVYSSNTLVNQPTPLNAGGAMTKNDNRMYSLLCLSCHDGVTSSFSLSARSMIVQSDGLGSDHPVNMDYGDGSNTALNPLDSVKTARGDFTVKGLPLYGRTVQCATCHDPHDNTNTNYLRQKNDQSHCNSCHR